MISKERDGICMIGKVIREHRKKQNMTLENLAAQTDLTPGGLSQIERGLIDPSLSALRRIAKALNISLNTMFTDDNPQYISRREERIKAIFSDVHVDYEFLTPKPGINGLTPKIEVVQVALRPDAWGDGVLTTHDADECFVVLSGVIEVETISETITLRQGDSIYLKEGVSHRLHNPTEKEAVGLSILSSMIY